MPGCEGAWGLSDVLLDEPGESTMTDAQIEMAARKLCELRGLDPDARVCRAHPKHHLLAIYPFLWEVAADEIRDFERIRMAIHEAMGAR